MEGLKKRIFVVTIIMIAVGLYFLSTGQPTTAATKTETWMEQKLPKTVEGFEFQASVANPEQTYRMEQRTYESLKPFGIVCRVYQKGSKAYDVVVLASADKASFHDPRGCFDAQGWVVYDDHARTVHTKHRGDVPIRLVRMDGTAASVGASVRNRLGAYCYRGPDGFAGHTLWLYWQLFKSQMFGNKMPEGVFYRFTSLQDNAPEKDLLDFIADYLDAAYETSAGYF